MTFASVLIANRGEIAVRVGVKGDVILLHREECASGDKPFYENQYRYTLSGKRLTLTKVKNLCPDEVALTILTSEPWTKVK